MDKGGFVGNADEVLLGWRVFFVGVRGVVEGLDGCGLGREIFSGGSGAPVRAPDTFLAREEGDGLFAKRMLFFWKETKWRSIRSRIPSVPLVP